LSSVPPLECSVTWQVTACTYPCLSLMCDVLLLLGRGG
jgi:hypothetical protein